MVLGLGAFCPFLIGTAQKENLSAVVLEEKIANLAEMSRRNRKKFSSLMLNVGNEPSGKGWKAVPQGAYPVPELCRFLKFKVFGIFAH